MNRIDFSLTGGMPMYQNTLDFLQQEYTGAINALANLAGKRAIIAGCETVGNTVKNGWLAIDGELVRFKGGVVQQYIAINESVESDTFEDTITKPLYYTRVAEFVNVGTIAWADFRRVEEMASVNDKINMLIEAEIGIAKPYFGKLEAIPDNHLQCNGATYNIADYPRLFAKIGNMYGGDGVNTFRMPSLQGRVIVGFDANTPDYPPNVINDGELNYGAIGNTGGLSAVKLTPAQQGSFLFGMRSGLTDNSHVGAYYGFRVNNTVIATTGNEQWQTIVERPRGDADVHENRQPYIVACYIMRY